MEKINIVNGKPSERILSLDEIKNDIFYHNSLYGVLKYEIKVGGESMFEKYILSFIENYESENDFIIVNIGNKKGIISYYIHENDLLNNNNYELYRFETINELFKWLTEKYE